MSQIRNHRPVAAVIVDEGREVDKEDKEIRADIHTYMKTPTHIIKENIMIVYALFLILGVRYPGINFGMPMFV